MKKRSIFIASLLLGLIVAFVIYQQVGFHNVFEKLKMFKGWQLLVLFSFTAGKVFVWVLRWKLILNKFGYKNLSFLSLSASRLGEMAVSYATPGIYWGGEGIRIFSLKKHHDIPFSKATSSVLLDRLFDIMGLCVFFFIGLILALFTQNTTVALLLFLGTLILLIAVFLILKAFGLKRILGWGVKFLHLDQVKSFSNGKSVMVAEKLTEVGHQMVDFLKKGSYHWISILLVSTLSFFLNVGQLVMFFVFLKGQLPALMNIFLSRSLMVFSGLSPVPGNLGVYEGVSVFGFKLVGLSGKVGLSFSLLARFFDVLFVSLGAVILISYGGVFFVKAINSSANSSNKSNNS